MEIHQESEWLEAQSIVLSPDLVAAAKQQLLFLAEVDRNRCLYDGPVLNRAIFRYKYCWLPLLAKHADAGVTESPLVVPLDCEWMWHCHRLNPVRYKSDCLELYGKILNNWNVLSSIQANSSKEKTEKIWKTLYPNEPYELDLNNDSLQDSTENFLGTLESTTQYDLISAVKRQSTFFFQVSMPYWNDDGFLEGAVARYKGFLHLIKRNRERSIKCFCVPTYDIDLIWHSHQLHPASYCKDLEAIMGKVLEHDDTDSDRTKGQKLDVGFSGTTKQWEDTFGSRYWRAGAMYRGTAPSPLSVNKNIIGDMQKSSVRSTENLSLIQLPKKMLVGVMLEIVDVRDLPSGHKSKLVVSFKKQEQDVFFNVQRQLRISSESEEKQVAVFQCEVTGELVFELISCSRFNFPKARPGKVLGTTSVNLESLLNVASKLPMEKWCDLTPRNGVKYLKPISMRIALSATPPIPAPYELSMVFTHSLLKSYFSYWLPGNFQKMKNWTTIVDEPGNEIIRMQMRDLASENTRLNDPLKKKVIGRTASSETHVLAEFNGTFWSLMNSDWILQRKKINDGDKHEISDGDKHVLELTGPRRVIIFRGRKLEFKTRYYAKEEEYDFMTAVEFSAIYPNGKAVSLMDFKYGYLEIKEEWLVLPVILSAFILSNSPKEGHGGFSS